jgi:predicted metal-dependent hydrolase
MFPEGEDFFVRSVRAYRDRITDPELKRQVSAFIGQEAIHGREHRQFNDRLGELGYPTTFLDRRVKYSLAILHRISPKQHQLAMTAALEHYTATLAEILLSSEELQGSTDSEEVRHIFLWHALEENEHKAVAFDVFKAVGGKERVRKGVMFTTTIGFILALVLGTVVSLALDPAARNPRRLRASLRELRRNPMVSKQARAMIADYYRSDFHPEDRDTTALLQQWRERLFGEQGTAVDRLKGVTDRSAGAA